MMKTWDDLKSVDDILTDREKEIIKEVENETNIRCPHLKKTGDYFYYCNGAGLNDYEKNIKLEPFDPIINARQSIAQIQLHCMYRHEACCYNKGSLPFPSQELKRN